MTQLPITFERSEQRAVVPVPERRKPVLIRKQVTRRGPDGRVLGPVLRTQEEIEEDFWKRVKRGGPDECWEWQAGRNSQTQGTNYGVVWNVGRRWKTHRFAYTITKGPIPEGLDICHTCDNPPCCNPNHLFAGTARDNALDCKQKGRMHREYGEERYNATLTPEKVREIRLRYKPRHPEHGMKFLAKEYGVAHSMIWSIVTRRRWKHVE